MKRTVVLVVLDGWGLGRDDESNPIYKVNPPVFARLAKDYPVASLQASGIAVGLPWGEVGNSEVGHLTLGAGKVIYQYYPRITMAIHDKSFFENEALTAAFAHAKKNGAAVNLAGLLSKGNVHASLEHLEALLEFAEKEGVPVKLHLFADGKDMPPRTLGTLLKNVPVERVSSLTGRYYAMDREGSWNLTEEAYRAMTDAGGNRLEDFAAAIAANEAKGLSEEFLPALRGKNAPLADGDALIFFNFREDSIRQLAEAFVAKEFSHFSRKELRDVFITTLTHYKDGFDVPVAFPPEPVTDPLGKVVADAGMIQLRLAETYKYAHVTYFFNGYVEPPFSNEYRVLIPSEPIPHPDEHPEMMAVALTDRLTGAIEERAYDFILVNYANPDTIAHSGNYKAVAEAVRVIDRELGRVIAAAEHAGAAVLVTSDHGNAEELLDPMTGRIETQHDPNPVPFHLVAQEYKGRRFKNQENLRGETIGILSDVAPTILELLGVAQPADMTGRSLLRELI